MSINLCVSICAGRGGEDGEGGGWGGGRGRMGRVPHSHHLITGSSWVSSTDPDGLVPRPHAKGEAGFGSAESDQFLEYLRNIQNFQVQILCVRVSNQSTRFVQCL